MTDGDNHPVTWTDSLSDRFPQFVIECTATHASQGLILDGNLGRVEVFVGIVAPAPLTVVAIAQCTSAHGRVANQKQYGIVAPTARTRNRACRHGLGNTVRRVVNHLIHIFDTAAVGYLRHSVAK